MEKDGCMLCPRNCGVDRSEKNGYCLSADRIRVARAALHFWEEPCISGEKGSGAVFFCGCSLRCVFCQNRVIAENRTGTYLTPEELKEIFFRLKEEGAENINLVTATHFLPGVLKAVRLAKEEGIGLPFVWNSSAYEKPEALKELEGLVDIYLPDLKYLDAEAARRYSLAPDYPKRAKEAIGEMVRQHPECSFDERGMLRRGVIVRHLLLPGNLGNGKKVVRYLYETYGDRIFLSLMNQYTPMKGLPPEFPELFRRVRRREYESLLEFALRLGIENAFFQEGGTAKESFIPEFGELPVNLLQKKALHEGGS